MTAPRRVMSVGTQPQGGEQESAMVERKAFLARMGTKVLSQAKKYSVEHMCVHLFTSSEGRCVQTA